MNKIDFKQGKTLDLTIKKLKLIVNFKNENIKNWYLGKSYQLLTAENIWMDDQRAIS